MAGREHGDDQPRSPTPPDLGFLEASPESKLATRPWRDSPAYLLFLLLAGATCPQAHPLARPLAHVRLPDALPDTSASVAPGSTAPTPWLLLRSWVRLSSGRSCPRPGCDGPGATAGGPGA